MTESAVDPRRHRPRPSLLRIGAARGSLEVRQFFREREGVVFSFLFPVMFLLLFASIFTGTVAHTGVSVKQLYVPGMIAAGIMSTSFLSLGVGIAGERDDGTLRRLIATPMPRMAYFVGKVLMVAVVGVAETAVLLLIGATVFGVHLPASAGRWLTFAWVGILGLVASALLGMAMSSVPRSARSAAAVINLPFVLLEFISGVFIPFNQLPPDIQDIASVFPLKWMAEGLRSAFLPDSFQAVEMGHSWEHGTTALVLAAWCLIGLVVCLTTFRWKGRRDG
ncbi:MAG: ABC transporter permease [Acidimicrobiales bacterium]